MTNMLATIVPKSDQLNADDLIGGQTKTIKITKVSLLAGDQPVSLNYEGDGGKPYKPCLSMRRVLVHVWGENGNAYVGKYLTIFRDEKVTFGGVHVGGVRISHMSGIKSPVLLALTASKGNKKPYKVQPLSNIEPDAPTLEDCLSDIATSPTVEGLAHKFKMAIKIFVSDQQRSLLIEAKDRRKDELTQPVKHEVDALDELLNGDDLPNTFASMHNEDAA